MSKLFEDTNIIVYVSDDSLTITTKDSNHKIHWNKLTRLKEIDNFMLLFTGKLHVASLPKEAFTNEHIDFIKSHITS